MTSSLPETTPKRALFIAAIVTGSFLLFLVQPMIARMALPRLGGAPAVWNSAMLVYQALLLGGYGYAHWIGRFSGRVQGRLHVALAACGLLMLPIGLMSGDMPVDANPFVWVPWLFFGSIGPLFFIVSAQAPLLQRWYGLTGGKDPYPLYAASNLGSFGGLISYPLIVEPLLPVGQQSLLWSGGYCLLMLLTALIALRLPAVTTVEASTASAEPISFQRQARWVLLAAIPSALMLSTSLHITTDVMAMPLLWVLPLGLYLLSFSAAFAEKRGLADMLRRIAPISLLAAGYGIFAANISMELVFASVGLVALFLVSTALHAEMFDDRPDPAHLTRFYFAMSLGGALGGLFGALFAPLVFNWTYEYPLLLLVSAFILGARPVLSLAGSMHRFMKGRGGWIILGLSLIISFGAAGWIATGHDQTIRSLGALPILFAALFACGQRWLFTGLIATLMLTMGGWQKLEQSFSGQLTRSFFGNYAVRDYPGNLRFLVHGTTTHGVQNRNPGEERAATTYYAPKSGIGLALSAVPAVFGPKADVGIVGLGAGTLACYRQPDQNWRFYEIDPAIGDIASDPTKFTFLSTCAPKEPILIGDARLVLERTAKGTTDLLAVDAFSSDSVPMHLLTREAFAVYGRDLQPSGLLMVHISNRFLNLRPVIAAAGQAGWSMRLRFYKPSPANKDFTPSIWMALSRNTETLKRLEANSPAGAWTALPKDIKPQVWTDDHASILPLIIWSLPF